MSTAPPEALRWYTRALKIPQLIGKLASGERIKGGPYRPVQLVTFLGVLVVGLWSMPLWGGLVGTGRVAAGVRVIVVLALAAGAGIAARKIPIGMVNPVIFLTGLLRSVARRRGHQLAGSRVALSGAARDRGRVLVTSPLPGSSETITSSDAASPTREADPSPTPPAQAPVPTPPAPEQVLASLLRSSHG